MRAIQGALIVASSIQIVLGYSQIWGLFSRYSSSLKCVRNLKIAKRVFKHLLYVFVQIFQSSWHGTYCWFGWIRVHSTRISCGRCGSIYFIFHGCLTLAKWCGSIYFIFHGCKRLQNDLKVNVYLRTLIPF